MSDIFISYANQDRPRIRPLVEALEARGWSVFWDTTLLPGETWRKKITTELDAARCVIVLWSRHSIESHFVEQEADDGQRRRILVPALLDHVTIPLGFRNLQAANLVGWDGAAGHPEFQRMLLAIERHAPLAAKATLRAAAGSGSSVASTQVAPPIQPPADQSKDYHLDYLPPEPIDPKPIEPIPQTPNPLTPETVRDQPDSALLIVSGSPSGYRGRRNLIAAALVGTSLLGLAVYFLSRPTDIHLPVAPALPSATSTEPATQAPSASAPKVKLNPKDNLSYVWIPPGTFMMGCSPGDSECSDNEQPPHKATIIKGFWVGQTEVTQVAYAAVTGKSNPSYFKGDDHRPVENVNWDEAKSYCEAAGGLRLPTEAEWEYAARAGNTTARYGKVADIAWYVGNSDNRTHPVGQKAPNGWGLYDMLGNVSEWCSDWYDSEQKYRVLRGGSWFDDSRGVRVSGRGGVEPSNRFLSIGFRCAGELR